MLTCVRINDDDDDDNHEDGDDELDYVVLLTIKC